MNRPAPSALTANRLIGTVLAGRYKLIELLGAGGMGAVYRAQHTHLECIRAVKVLLSRHAEDPSLVKRFHREARGLSRLDHPNVVKVVDTGETEAGLPFIAMEFLAGEPLSATVKREGRLPWPTVKHIGRQVCSALHAAHQAGIIHRDIKPENCFRVDDDGDDYRIKLLDFGIAKLQADHASHLTETGLIIGTLHYMSYEQICGEPCDHQSDIWSVGVMLYKLLTGQLPFRGNNLGQVSFSIMSRDPPPISEVVPGMQFPRPLEFVIARALEKERGQRYQTVQDLLEAIDAVPDTLEEAITTPIARKPIPQLHRSIPTTLVAPPEDTELEKSTAILSLGNAPRVLGVARPQGPPLEETRKFSGDRHVSFGWRLLTLGAAFVGGILLLSALGEPPPSTTTEKHPKSRSEFANDIPVAVQNSLSPGSDSEVKDSTTSAPESSSGVRNDAQKIQEPSSEPIDLTHTQVVETPVENRIQEVPKEVKTANKPRSFKKRTSSDLKRLKRGLAEDCMSYLPAGSTISVDVKVQPNGRVDWIDWDKKSQLKYAGTGVKECLRRSTGQFQVTKGRATDSSYSKTLVIRK